MSMFSSIAKEGAYNHSKKVAQEARKKMEKAETIAACLRIMDEVIKEFQEEEKCAIAGY